MKLKVKRELPMRKQKLKKNRDRKPIARKKIKLQKRKTRKKPRTHKKIPKITRRKRKDPENSTSPNKSKVINKTPESNSLDQSVITPIKTHYTEKQILEILPTLKLPKPGQRMYFNKDVETAIILYNNAQDEDLRNILYSKCIMNPFNKLVENIINRFKFQYIGYEYDFADLQVDVISFLMLNLEKYNPNKGKAYSYFSNVAKNYLILKNNNAYAEEKSMILLSNEEEKLDRPGEEESIFDLPQMMVSSVNEQKEDISEFTTLVIKFWEQNVDKIFKKRRDKNIVYALLTLMERSYNIDSFNRKALYIMIREMTDVKTSYISKVVSVMKRYMKSHLIEFNKTGGITMDFVESNLFMQKEFHTNKTP